jgi:ribosomal protein S10
MKEYCLKVTTKNEKSLKKFLIFFFKHLKTKFDIIQKLSAVQNRKRVFTLLTSPHVNKSAQEHFELRIFSNKIKLNVSYANKNIIFVKKILNKAFHDIAVKLELKTDLDTEIKNQLAIFCPDNFHFTKQNFSRKNYSRKIQAQKTKTSNFNKNLFKLVHQFLNIFSIFGEMLLTFSYK